jgi:hypothetical protein
MANEEVAGLYLVVDSKTIQARAEIDKLTKTVKESSRQMKADMMETRASIKQIGEEIGVNLNRHLVSFMAKLPGAGVFAKAFPIAAVAGIGMAFAESGKKAFEFFEKSKAVAGEIGEAMQKMRQDTAASNNELALGNAKISEQIAKLEHKPVNSLAVALAEARVKADDLAKALGRDIEEMGKLLKEKQVTIIGGMLTDQTPTAGAQAMEERHFNAIKAVDDSEIEELGKTKTSDEKDEILKNNRIKRLAIQENKKNWNELHDAQTQLIARDEGYSKGSSKNDPGVHVNDALLTIYGNFGHQFEAMRHGIELTGERDDLDARLKRDQDAKQNTSERLKAMQRDFETRELLHGMSLGEEVLYWQRYTNAFAQGSDQWIEVNRKLEEAEKAFQKQNNEPGKFQKEGKEEIKRQSQPVPLEVSSNSVALKMEQDNLTHAGERWREYRVAVVSAQEQDVKMGVALDATRTRFLAETGVITKQQEKLRDLTSEMQSFAKLIDIVNAEKEDVQSDASLTDVQRATQLQQVQNRLAQLTGEQVMKQAEVNAFTRSMQLRNAMATMFDEWILKCKDTEEQFKELWSQFSTSMNDSMAKAMLGQKTSFSGVFRSLGETLTKDALKQSEARLAPYATSALHKVPGLGGWMDKMKKPPVAATTMTVTAQTVNLSGAVSGAGGAAGSMGSPTGDAAWGASGSTASSALSTAGSAMPALGGLMSAFSSSGAGAGFEAADLGDALGGAMAFGGPVLAGVSYDVGEMGREKFVPDTNGHIVPHHALGEGGAFYEIHAEGASAAEVDQRVQRALSRVHNSAVQNAVAVQAERRRRGPNRNS